MSHRPSRPGSPPDCRLVLMLVLCLGLPAQALAAAPRVDDPPGSSAEAEGRSRDAGAAGEALRAALYPSMDRLLRPGPPRRERLRERVPARIPASRQGPAPADGPGGLLGALDELIAPGELLADLGRFVEGDHLLVLGAGAALSGASMGAPDDLAFGALRPDSLATVTDPLSTIGSRVTLYPALAATFAGAKLAGAPEAASTAAQLTQALILADLVVTPMKLGARRLRPDGSNRLSYPSGHTAGAFAVATVLHRRYGEVAAVPAYAYAVLMGVARIEGRKHHLSDVLAGAVIGALAGSTVSDRFAGRDLRIEAVAGPAGGAGVGFTLRF